MSCIVHRYLRFTAGSKDVVNPCELIWNWTPQATMTMQAMRCAEEAYGLYYYFDSSRESLCYSLPWVFFQRSFSLSGSSTGLLVAACGSCVSHLPRYILLIDIFFSRYGFRESRRGWQQLSCLDVYSLNDSISQCRASGSVGKCTFALAYLMLLELRKIR